MTSTFQHLFSEIEAINSGHGYVGALDALMYIGSNIEHYRGTAVIAEYHRFMAEGAKMMQPCAA